MRRILQKKYPTYWNLLIPQDLLSNLVNNPSEEIHIIKCKCGHDDKKRETCKFKSNYCSCAIEYKNDKDDLIENKFLCCNKFYQRKFDEKLKKLLYNTYKFFNHDNNKFILLLWKGVYLHEYMDDWKDWMKLYFLKKKIFLVTCIWNMLLMQIMNKQKEIFQKEIFRRVLWFVCSIAKRDF